MSSPSEPPKDDQPHTAAELAKLREILRTNPYVVRYHGETLRGLVIAVASIVDKKLDEMLRSHLVDDKDVMGKMFGEIGPLGSFAARAQLGFLLGLYHKFTLTEMLLVNRIRNRMAHDPEITTFEHPRVKGLYDNLKLWKALDQNRQMRPAGLSDVFDQSKINLGWDPSIPGYHYLVTVTLLAGLVDYAKQTRPS